MLTKNSFSLPHFFYSYQILKNKKNYLYTRFSNEINGVEVSFPTYKSWGLES